MKLRLIALLLAVPAVVASLLVFTPAEAATPRSYISTDYVTMTEYSTTGVMGKVSVACRGSARCSGKVYFEDSENRKRPFSLKGNSKATLTVTMNKSSKFNPLNTASTLAETKGRDNQYKAVAGVKLMLDESAPRNIAPYAYTVQTETRSPGRIYYTVNGSNLGLKSMHVELHEVLRGGNTRLVNRRDVFDDAKKTGYFSSSLGTNNVPGPLYRLRVTATDNDNESHAWWWRGVSGNSGGGGRYLRDSNSVYSTKNGFDAQIYFGSISGKAPSGATIKALAPPPVNSSSATVRRELDVPSCANIFDETVAANESYTLQFLPFDNNGVDKRYMVNAKLGSTQVWLGAGETPYGSCSDVLDYKFSRDNLMALSEANESNTVRDISSETQLRKSGNDITVRRYYSGFKPTSADKWVRLREKVPGLSVLDSPVVAQGSGSVGSDGRNAVFQDLPPGRYWVEVGRRTGCATWYPSRYPNNSAYFNGADRGAEGWKSFSTLTSLPGSASTGLERIAIVHGASYKYQGKRPSGYAGWMYREYCKAYGTGTYSNTLEIDGYEKVFTKVTSTNRKGAMVYGRVTRAGGKTNKEIMVRVSSVDGTRVLRTDYTDGSGKFYIAGLPSGNWTISVNTDSWRGIGRTFTGKHSVRVSAGRNYNVGTLRFKG